MGAIASNAACWRLTARGDFIRLVEVYAKWIDDESPDELMDRNIEDNHPRKTASCILQKCIDNLNESM